MKEIRLVSPLCNTSGFAKAGRALLASLLSVGYTVEAVETETALATDANGEEVRLPQHDWKSRPIVQERELQEALLTKVSPDAPTLILNPPDGMSGFHEFCKGLRIGYTMLEADAVNPVWARSLRNVDALITPCQWNSTALTTAAPDTPCYVVPLPIDERLWSAEGATCVIPNRPAFLFCAVFSVCERKHWKELIQAFTEEFAGEDVGLLIKPDKPELTADFVDACKKRGAWIETVSQRLTDSQMAAMYRSCDCYALPSAEGFGVTFVEAMLCGLPIVALDAGGTGDIVNTSNGFPLPAIWEPCIGHLPQIYRSTYNQPTVGIPVLRTVLRQAYEEGSSKAEAARTDALERFTRCTVGAQIEAIIESLQAQPKKVSIHVAPRRLPKLTAIITTHNHIEKTKLCVASLRSHVRDCRIILADDNSTDGTGLWAHVQDTELIPCSSGGNVSANRQEALDYMRLSLSTDDSYVCFFDNDVEIQSGFWEGLWRVLSEYPAIGVLSPAKRYKQGHLQNIGNRVFFDGGTTAMRLEREVVYCDYVESACMVMRPEVWQSIDWDTQFPIFYEDTDYCFQARELGYDIAATASVEVIHYAHSTSSTRAEESEANRQKFLRKWRHRL